MYICIWLVPYLLDTSDYATLVTAYLSQTDSGGLLNIPKSGLHNVHD